MNFGEKLRELRLAQSYSQRELAERLDVSFTYLSKLENNRMDRPPSEEFGSKNGPSLRGRRRRIIGAGGAGSN